MVVTAECVWVQIDETCEFVKVFRKKYKKKADALLNYMKFCWSEFRNSQHPANGYEKRVWNTCCNSACNRAGKCSEGMPFTKDYWNKPAKTAAMLPIDKLTLLLELKQGRSIKDALTKNAA